MPKKPEITNVQTVAESQIFRIEGVDLKFENGEERSYERLRGTRRGAVMIIPMLDDNTILLAREYGVGVEDYYMSFPKGIMEAEEDIAATANRELKEEMGYGAKDISLFMECVDSPGYAGGKMRVLIARDLYPESLEGDEPEPIEVVKWSLDKVGDLLAHPEFYESRSVAALLLLERQVRGK